jgi:hypothetical protein
MLPHLGQHGPARLPQTVSVSTVRRTPFSRALLLPLGASAVPIHAANGVADTTPNRTSGPRRPGPIPQPSQNTDLSTQSSNGRGRPVPGKASLTADKAMAAGTPVLIP